MREVVDLIGGPAIAAIRLEDEKGISPVDLAIRLIGGPVATAKALGYSREGFNKMLHREIGEWKVDVALRLADLSGIPYETLMRSVKSAKRRNDDQN